MYVFRDEQLYQANPQDLVKIECTYNYCRLLCLLPSMVSKAVELGLIYKTARGIN